MRQDLLESVLMVLKEIEGYFVFKDEAGKEFVILSKEDFDGLDESSSKEEKQLSLSSALLSSALEKREEEKMSDVDDRAEEKVSADDILEKINRDIALYNLLQEEEVESDVLERIEEDEIVKGLDEPVLNSQKVRFEPLRGDLSPDLQE